MDKLRLDLLENGIDSLQQGIDLLLTYKESPKKLKVAILLVAQAVELILKERLRQEHWSLIYKEIDRAGKEGSQTVSLEDARKRLESAANVVFKREEWTPVENFQKTRNNIQHFKVDLSFEHAVSQTHLVLCFLTNFLQVHLNKNLKDLLDEDSFHQLLEIEEINKTLEALAIKRIDELVNHFTLGKLKRLQEWDFAGMFCPICEKNTYVFFPSQGISKCELCGYEGGIAKCVVCGEKMLPEYGFDKSNIQEGLFFCANCLFKYQEA